MARSPMLCGDVRRVTLSLALPSLCAMAAYGLGTLLDALLLARINAAAAVSVSFPVFTLIQTIGFTLGMGAGSLSSRSLGKNQPEDAQQAARFSLQLALILGTLLAAALPFAPSLVAMLGASPAIASDAACYARFLLAAAPAMCTSLVLSSLMRARGQTRPYMTACLLGAGAGAALEWLLVYRAQLGVTGAGAALLVREGMILLILGVSAIKSGGLPSPFRLALPDRRIPAGILRYGLPTLLRQGALSVSSAFLSRASASFGEDVLAGMGIAVRTAALISSCVIGFGQGFTPVCGCCLGAGELDRARRAYAFCQKTVILALLAAGAALYASARPLLLLFGAQEGVADFGARVLRAQSPVLFAQGSVILMNMLVQCMGRPVRASLVATSRQGLCFLPLLLMLPRLLGQTGLVICQSVSDVLSLALSWLLTRRLLDAQGVDRTPRRA